MPDAPLRRATDRSRLLVALCAPVLLAGCWDAPVRERLEIAPLADGSARAELVVELDSPKDHAAAGEEALRRRIERKARDLESGADPWLDHFEIEGCPRQEGAWRRDDGELVEFRRGMHCETLEAALRVIDPAPVAADVARDGERVELTLLPLGGGPASRGDRERAEAEIDRWAERLESYFAAAWAIAARAGERPDLALALWAEALDASPERWPREIDDGERPRTEALRERVDAALEIFRVRPGERETPDERVRAAYDPLPARLIVRLPVAPLALDGFEELGGERFAAPERSLYATFRALEGRWLAPDPLVETVELGRAGRREEISPAPFAAADPRRQESPPTREEIATALREALGRRDPLRLVWSAPPAEEGGSDAGVE